MTMLSVLLWMAIWILVVLILYRFYIYRSYFLTGSMDTTKEKEKEGFSVSGDETSAIKSYLTAPPSIQNVPEKYQSNALRQFSIKGAYNSAVTGHKVDATMVPFLLSRGCRFLDFEVFYIDRIPQVAYTKDNKYYDAIDTDNSVPLDRVLTSAITNAFSPPSPDPLDPLFIQLRIKVKDDDKMAVYKAVASSIDATIQPKLYQGAVSGDTPLKELMGKIVLLMDKSIEPDYKNYSSCSGTGDNDMEQPCYELTKYVNMDAGSNDLHILHYTMALQQSPNAPVWSATEETEGSFTTTVKTFSLVEPDVAGGGSNPDTIRDFITKQGCQIVMPQYSILDKGLLLYEEVYNYWKGGIVPLALMIKGFQENKTK